MLLRRLEVRKLFLSLFFISGWLVFVFAQSAIAETITIWGDEVWDPNGSPYVYSGVYIEENASLTIETNVVVRITPEIGQSQAQLRVKDTAHLSAYGSIFVLPGEKCRVWFLSGSTGVFNGCEVGGQGSIEIYSSSVSITGCQMNAGATVKINNGAPMVQGNTFNATVWLSTSEVAVVQGNTFPSNLVNPYRLWISSPTTGISGNTYEHEAPWIYVEGEVQGDVTLGSVDGIKVFRLSDHVTIPYGTSLTIEPNVSLTIAGATGTPCEAKTVNVFGEFIARACTVNLVPGICQAYLRFQSGSAGRLDQCGIYQGGYITISSGDVSITKCHVKPRVVIHAESPTVDGNTFYYNAASNIYCYSTATPYITNNTFTSSTTAVEVKDDANPAVHYNNFDPTSTGVNNAGSKWVDATYNWWGDPTGPGPIAEGFGANVSEKVIYEPWLGADTCLNGIQDPDEEGIDCGGSCANPCFEGGPDEYQVWGYVRDWEGNPVGNAEVAVYRNFGQGHVYPIWEGYTDPCDGYYITSCLDTDWPVSPDLIYSSLDNDVVVVRDSSNNSRIISKTESVCDSIGLCWRDFVFGSGGPYELQERDGIEVFRQTNVACLAALEDFEFLRRKITTYVYANNKTSQECSGLPCFIAPSFQWPLCELVSADGNIYYPQQETSDVLVWHEYGHAIHYDSYQCTDFKKCSMLPEEIAEGWANYFRSIRDIGGLDHEAEANKGVVFPTTPFADVLIDIIDGGTGDIDNDPIDGTIINAKERIWTVLDEDEPKNVREFYQDFTDRYGYECELCDIYEINYRYLTSFEMPECSLGQRSLSLEGQIGSGTETIQSIVDSTTSKAKFYLSWEGSDLDLTLITPNDIIIDPNYASNNPNITYVEDEAIEYYIVINPPSGQWQMDIEAIETPPGGEDFVITSFLITNLILTSSTDSEIYDVNEPIAITAKLFYHDILYSDANVVAEIQYPNGSQIITLFDDGLYNDSNSNDGIYANIYENTSIESEYNIIVTATGQNPFGEPFVRQTTKSVTVQNLPDLIPIELTTDDDLTEGEITLTATIRNAGSKDANDILVEFYYSDGDDIFEIDPNATLTIDYLEPNQIEEVSIIWDVTCGTYDVFVVADAFNEIPEKDEANNYVVQTLSIRRLGDANTDCIIDLRDLANCAAMWLQNCSEPTWCKGCDFDRSELADITDIITLAEHWLEGTH